MRDRLDAAWLVVLHHMLRRIGVIRRQPKGTNHAARHSQRSRPLRTVESAVLPGRRRSRRSVRVVLTGCDGSVWNLTGPDTDGIWLIREP